MGTICNYGITPPIMTMPLIQYLGLHSFIELSCSSLSLRASRCDWPSCWKYSGHPKPWAYFSARRWRAGRRGGLPDISEGIDDECRSLFLGRYWTVGGHFVSNLWTRGPIRRGGDIKNNNRRWRPRWMSTISIVRGIHFERRWRSRHKCWGKVPLVTGTMALVAFLEEIVHWGNHNLLN